MLKWNVGPITDPLVRKSTKHDLGKDDKYLVKVIYLLYIGEVLFQWSHHSIFPTELQIRATLICPHKEYKPRV